ncbi:SpoIIE family protein phosphatase [Streptomyces sp. NPDC004227]
MSGPSDHSGKRSLRSLLSVRSIAGQVLLLQVGIVVLLVITAVVALVLQAQRSAERAADQRSLGIAEAFAHSPGMVRALDSRHPTAVLQPLAEQVRKASGVDYVVVGNIKGIRYTHPDPRLIGKHVIGPYKEALGGKAFTRTYSASRGPAVNSVVPVTRPDGSVAGLVWVGITVQQVHTSVGRQLPVLLGSAAVALTLATGSYALVGRRLRRQTHGLGPIEVTRMYEHHDAVLHSVREGVLILDEERRLLLANDEARRLLDLPPDAEGRPFCELGLEPRTAELLGSGRVASDEVVAAGDRLLTVNVRIASVQGRPARTVVTLRDTTELRALAGRAEVAQGRLELLYEAGMRIGTTLDVRRTAEELTDVVVPRFADIATVELLDPVPRGDEPSGKRTRLRRTAVSSGLNDQPLYPVGELISFAPSTPHASAVEHGHAVLETDLEAAHGWRAWDPQQAEKILACGLHSLIAVPLQARGVMLGLATFWRTRKKPFGEEDLSLVEELAARAAVCIDNARRYTREHAMAVTLQRRLLPQGLPEQDALEVAYRYLPAQAGVGGDWFDVIPLPGARVALVVGDVVGHGLHAAATMGRLRTAVHNFSALDLPPDELLAHLDDLVAKVDQEQTGAEEGARTGVTGATCLYAIYDPVCGRCSMARAGHPGPALVHPDGTVSLPDVPGSPPLGLSGSLPIEVTELQLAEGSHLVLFTDGLVEDRHRDFDAGLMLLLDTLSGTATQTPEQTCQTVFNTMVPDRPRDDIALLVARTRMLDPAQVADWDVPSDPAAVAPVRGACGRQLQAWGLEDIQFTAELILSELITNAIRYGTQPIHVRLLRDRDLICEVSDGSSTSPHLRRAETTDEGGRGLFLVAQFAQGWGTRYTPHGKIIWTELPLRTGAAEPIEQPSEILLDQWSDEAFH